MCSHPRGATCARRSSGGRRLSHLRYAGTDTALIVPYGAPEQVVPVFTEAHRARFGFATPERPLIVEAVAVEATSAGDPVRETRVSRRDGSGPDPVDQRRCDGLPGQGRDLLGPGRRHGRRGA